MVLKHLGCKFFGGMIYNLFFFPKSYPHFCVLWVTNFNGTVIKENHFQVAKKNKNRETSIPVFLVVFFLTIFRVVFVSESSAGKQRWTDECRPCAEHLPFISPAGKHSPLASWVAQIRAHAVNSAPRQRRTKPSNQYVVNHRFNAAERRCGRALKWAD